MKHSIKCELDMIYDYHNMEYVFHTIQGMLLAVNPFVELYRNAKEVQTQRPTVDVKISIKAERHGLGEAVLC